jgi:hydrogenase assembly chaperone HypC/HupF
VSDCDHDVCITCGDHAVPMRVVRIDVARSLALCEAEDGGRESVEIALVEPVSPGDSLLVHAGTALQVLAPVPAAEGGWVPVPAAEGRWVPVPAAEGGRV